MSKIRRLKSPLRIDLVLNGDCNHKCAHCYNPWRDGCSETARFDEDAVIRNLDRIADELAKNEVWSAILTGGEPLMHPRVLAFCIRRLNEAGISMSLNTNLTRMTAKLAEGLVKECGWTGMILTSLPSISPDVCDEITRVPGSFGRIMKGIETCRNAGIRVGVNTVVTKRNLADLPRFADFAEKNRLEYVSLSTVIPPAYDPDNPVWWLDADDVRAVADALIDVKERAGAEIGSVVPLPLCLLGDAEKYMPVLETTCTAGVGKCSVNAVTGEVNACGHGDASCGSVLTDGLAKCWKRMEKWGEDEILADECRNCGWLFLCGGECRMMRRMRKIAGKTGSEAPYVLSPEAEIRFPARSGAEAPAVGDDEKLRVRPGMKARKEEFGYVVRFGFTETMMTDAMFGFLSALRKKGTFSAREAASMTSNPEIGKELVRTLLFRGALERSR